MLGDPEMQAEFRSICRNYFPRWRAGQLWTVVQGPRGSWVDQDGRTHVTAEQGFCERYTKTIYINYGWDDTPRLVLIHEICHAVTSGGHTRRFCERLRKAAQRAAALGDKTLRALLTQEADAYTELLTEPEEWRANVIYRRLQHILTNVPSATYDEAMMILASEFVSPVPELLERYPHLPRVHEQYRRSEMAALRARIKNATKAGISPVIVTRLQERLQAFENPGRVAAGREQP